MASIVVFFTNYGPYHLARLEAFQKVCNQKNWNLNCIEFSRVEELYPWEISKKSSQIFLETLDKDNSVESLSTHLMIERLFKKLNILKPDVIAIAGYANIIMLSALVWSVLNRKKAILLSASKEDDALRNPIIETIKSQIVRFYAAALVGGNPQKRYLQKLGMPCDSINFGYNVVGNDSFHPSVLKNLENPLDKPYFLSVNRFVPKKNIFFLLEVYNLYQKSCPSTVYDLVLCGDGPLRAEIEAYIIENELENKVHLPGFLQHSELKAYYAHAKCFIHASLQEQWGLVVNEAMAAGLPVIVSNQCGCFEDLIVEGVNGFGFRPNNPKELLDLMLKVTSRDIDLEGIGTTALKYIQNFSPEYFANGLRKSVEHALSF